MISSAFWTPYFRNKYILSNMHYYFLSISISFLKFLSRSARNKENKNGTRTGFKLHYVPHLSILGFLNLHLEVVESFLILSGHYNLRINIFHLTYTIIFYPVLFHFYIACLDHAGIRETKTGLARVLNCRTNAVHGFQSF